MVKPSYPSDSSVHQRAEIEIVADIAERLHVELSSAPIQIPLAGGTSIKVDAATTDLGVVVEAPAVAAAR